MLEVKSIHNRWLFVVWIMLFLIIFPGKARSLVFDRREKPKAEESSYFLYPAVYTVPGFGKGVGGGLTVSDMLGEESEVTLLHLKGDWTFDSAIITDLPIFTRYFTISMIYADLYDGGVAMYERGPDSSSEPVIELELERLLTRAAEVSLNLFDQQIELYYGYAFSFPLVKRVGVFNDSNDEEDSEATEERFYQYLRFLDLQRIFVVRRGLYIDDTDDRRDPHVGYRFQFERYGFETEGNWKSYHVDDFNFTAFIPNEDETGVLVLNAFFSAAEVTKPADIGEIDEGYCTDPENDLDEEEQERCLIFVSALNRFIEDEGKNADSTHLGGLQRLRSYPQGRFHDRYSVFFGIEYRKYYLIGSSPFDFFIEKGIFNGIQLAFFYELGQVAPENDHSLFEDMKSNYGLGFRLVFSKVVVRLDYTQGSEGAQATAFIGYPF